VNDNDLTAVRGLQAAHDAAALVGAYLERDHAAAREVAERPGLDPLLVMTRVAIFAARLLKRDPDPRGTLPRWAAAAGPEPAERVAAHCHRAPAGQRDRQNGAWRS
jgi:hypothetical protein